MSDLQTRSIQLAILSTGTNPELARTVIDATTVPTAQGAGYDVGSALFGELRVHLRRTAPRMQVDIYITTVDLTAGVTYSVVIDGNTSTYTVPGSPPASLSALCEAIAASINADSGVNTIVTATAVQRTATGNAGGTTYNTVRLVWDGVDATTLVVNISGSTARCTLVADPETARVRVYGCSTTPSVSTRLAAEYDDLARALAWDILRGEAGTAADFTLTAGLGYRMPVYVASYASLIAYVTGVANSFVTTATATTVNVITVQNPLVLVTYGRVGA